MPTTLEELSRRLNLSKTTISRALDGYSDVARATRERVVRAARELGYVPSHAARQLRRQRSDAIGYILPSHLPGFSDPFFGEFVAGLCDEAAASKMHLMISSCPPGSPEEQSLYHSWVVSRQVDGIVLNRVRLQDWRVDFLLQSGLPFAALGHPPGVAGFPCVWVSARKALAALIDQLAAQGRARIAYIGGPPDLVVQAERLNGYREGLARAGLAADETLVLAGDQSEQGGYAAAQILLDLPQPPGAILNFNDATAQGVLRAARERGLLVGRDLAVAGYEGTRESALTDPPLTTLAQPGYDIARRLVRLLMRRIHGAAPEAESEILEARLVLRASTGA